ncbi:bile acid:sodium symporter family protein [Zunongwangia pacifica]|uniref:Bile acid:sodium symporter n=1 Tax=Zunongwangia pacifica TaxID=2911062 RepID=A0A9X1ZTG6_9FLAO|nr:bile acid:sodium symporter family protein [Zunongwangia pacifica]MCL6217340.1 bile acid:sodium symporter [Zunongwangia pacifica]
MKINGFIVSLFGVILLAYLLPQGNDLLPLKTITDIGIGLIFFFYGLKLAPQELKLGLLNYKVHIIVQLTTFVVFPLLAIAYLPLFEQGKDSELWTAIFFLATLPSTVSSSIVMVALAKGNLPTAIFNASLSGIIGIFATPIWLSLILGKSADFQFIDVLVKLGWQILAPLILGLLLQRFFGDWARKNSKKLALFDKGIILIIVYSSFSHSFTSNLFETIDLMGFLLLILGVLVLFFAVYYLTAFVSKLLNLSTEDKITAQFCGTKKSLVHGSVMVKVIFGNAANTGLLLLPIMLFHSSQLILIAYFAEKYRNRDAN